jgi:hypothetical protein
MKVQIGNQTIEVPQGVEVKIIDEEKHKYKFVPGQYVACNGAVYRITSLTDRGYAVKEVRAPKDADEWETIELGFINEPKMELLPDYEEIIDEWGDAHDPELRRKINDAWNKNREGFCPILRALYARDIDEITDHDAFQYKEWIDTPEFTEGLFTNDWEDYNEMALKHMEREWDYFADNYLNHIADDCDLECILNFLHYPYLPVYNN